MDVGGFRDDGGQEPYKPCEYQNASEIPFAPDGIAPVIRGAIEKVRGTSGRFSGLSCCIRKTVVATNTPYETDGDATKRKLAQEVKILHFARHHHVIRLIHSYFQSDNEDETRLAIIMDRADSNLSPYLEPGKDPPHKNWFGCLISVVHHIHNLGVRHRDIKPANILVKGGNLLLADFGLSKMGLGRTLPTTNLDRNSGRTREYCAPEVEQGRTRGRSADIFSLGAVFLEMLTAYTNPDEFKQLTCILRPTSRQNSSYAKNIDRVHKWMAEDHGFTDWQDKLLTMCKAMLSFDRDRRPTAEQLDIELSGFDETLKCKCMGPEDLSEVDSLVDACRYGSADEVRRLLDSGADPNTMSAIHYASERGLEDIVRALLGSGANVDLENPVGQTALHCAARNGSEAVVRLLLESGAEVDARDENDQTPLHGASGQGYAEIVNMLLASNADVDAEDLDGDTAFHFADRRGHKAVLELLESHEQNNR